MRTDVIVALTIMERRSVGSTNIQILERSQPSGRKTGQDAGRPASAPVLCIVMDLSTDLDPGFQIIIEIDAWR
jgi:hypothetical protein